MENSSIHLPDLKAGCCSNTAEVRLISFEEAKNVKNDGHHRDVQMLLPNERVTPDSHHRVLLALST
ncbi:hypothetical protein Bca52824_023082 [Brassica carinata]|uniref:Uncharacterized protein n=1 Tax=Brassica carinata TaxID=52824 RepID=A0A8X7VHJ2_BRACI|nr:hypothetical protein Bca52824_023082 [Brassica carinata]